jgi:hypothetical protein
MSQSARLFWALAVLALIFQVAVLGSSGRFQESAADGSDKAKSQQTTKASKKRKKKKAVTTVPYVVFSPAPPPVIPSSPITTNSVEALPTTPLPAARNVSGAEKTPGVHVSPTGIPTEAPLGPAPTATAGQLIISEFRVRGINGPQDEFIEIYNTTGADHTVAAASGTGYGVAASDGVTRCSIPNGTVIPARGHYLCVNSVGFSLGAYPAGSGTIGTGDATYTTDIPDNAGIALFNNNTGGGSYSLANRLDAVGSTSEANTTYKEGTGYPPINPAFNINYSFYRDNCGKGGSITTFAESVHPEVCLSTPITMRPTSSLWMLTAHLQALDSGSVLRGRRASPVQSNAILCLAQTCSTQLSPSPILRIVFGTLLPIRRTIRLLEHCQFDDGL